MTRDARRNRRFIATVAGGESRSADLDADLRALLDRYSEGPLPSDVVEAARRLQEALERRLRTRRRGPRRTGKGG